MCSCFCAHASGLYRIDVMIVRGKVTRVCASGAEICELRWGPYKRHSANDFKFKY
jgi:hypothetical protein